MCARRERVRKAPCGSMSVQIWTLSPAKVLKSDWWLMLQAA